MPLERVDPGLRFAQFPASHLFFETGPLIKKGDHIAISRQILEFCLILGQILETIVVREASEDILAIVFLIMFAIVQGLPWKPS